MKIFEKNINDLANLLKVLGEPSRLKIFKILLNCCCEVSIDTEYNISKINGLTVGEVCCKFTGENNITSTISHHLKELRLSGLINMDKKGKNIICSVNKNKIKFLLDNLNNFLGEQNE